MEFRNRYGWDSGCTCLCSSDVTLCSFVAEYDASCYDCCSAPAWSQVTFEFKFSHYFIGCVKKGHCSSSYYFILVTPPNLDTTKCSCCCSTSGSDENEVNVLDREARYEVEADLEEENTEERRLLENEAPTVHAGEEPIPSNNTAVFKFEIESSCLCAFGNHCS